MGFADENARSLQTAMKISPAESVIMEALWRRAPLRSETIMTEVCAVQGWTEGTVKVLLSRLRKKQAISVTAEGRRYQYSPLIDRNTYVQAESQSLLDRCFSGRLAGLATHLWESGRLSDEDVAALTLVVAKFDRAP